MGKINKKLSRTFAKKFKSITNFKCEPLQSKNGDAADKEEVKEAEVELEIVPLEQSTENNSNDKPQNSSGPKKKKKNFKAKVKTSFYEKCAKTRLEKGMILLPQKIETKIYKIKKALRKKGVDDNEIRDIIRKKRREEELKIRKEEKTLCFKCRQPGHSLASCPQNEASQDESAVDICYFCGSTEHILSDCSKYKAATGNKKKKKPALPYAKCFICGQSGHLTNSCTDNEKGVYPRGGKCRICGSINHLVKDCNQNKDKDKPEEEEIILQTYSGVSYSVDADDFEMTTQSTTTQNKGSMRVKF